MDLRLCRAIARRALLMFGYRGTVRVVEPHLYGRLTTGREALSAWMRPGWSRTNPEGGWRLFLLDEIENLGELPEHFAGPRPDFNPEDPHFPEVFCRVDADETAEGPGAAGEPPAAPGGQTPNGNTPNDPTV